MSNLENKAIEQSVLNDLFGGAAEENAERHNFDTCRCHCDCGRLQEYGENRDDDGEVLQAWWYCGSCDYYNPVLS